MKPCPHCQANEPIVYNDSLYCGNCNTPYPVTKRVYAIRDSREIYIEMRDCGVEILQILQRLFAEETPSPELVDAYQWVQDKVEQYDEWGNT